jgi:hypothetical protein
MKLSVLVPLFNEDGFVGTLLERVDAAQRRLESSPDPVEACEAERETWCIVVPRLSAITPELRAEVNGKPVYVSIGGTVGAALWEAKFKGSGPVKVLRPWQGKMIPVEPEKPEMIQRLVLLGGEKITY